MARTSEFPQSTHGRSLRLTSFYSADDLFAFEIEAGGTQFQASGDARTAFEVFMAGNQWMIYRNVLTDVLHWDFVRWSLVVCELPR